MSRKSDCLIEIDNNLLHSSEFQLSYIPQVLLSVVIIRWIVTPLSVLCFWTNHSTEDQICPGIRGYTSPSQGHQGDHLSSLRFFKFHDFFWSLP